MQRALFGMFVMATAVAVLTAQQTTPKPSFRSGIDVTRMDVTVLDDQHQPVHGMTAADFTVFINGKPQRIVNVAENVMPPVEPPTAPWMNLVAPDVRNNSLADPRLFVIVIDDVSLESAGPDLIVVKQAKTAARGVIDRLGPLDLAAVVFSGDNRHAQDFTNDRAKLYAAVDSTRGTMVSPFLQGRYSIETLTEVNRMLAIAPQSRRAIVWISTGGSADPSGFGADQKLGAGTDRTPVSGREDALELSQAVNGLAGSTHLSNVHIYSINPAPLRPFATGGTSVPNSSDILRTISANSGGRTIADTTDFSAGLNQVFEENNSYYVIAYETPPAKEDEYQRIEVKLNRRGLTLLAPNGYHYTPKPPKPPKTAPSPLTLALSRLIPKSDVPLMVSLAPFAIPAAGNGKPSGKSALAVVLGVRQPTLPGSTAQNETLEFETVVFDGEGRRQLYSERRSALVKLRPGPHDEAQYDVLTRFDLAPGRYSLRFGTRSVSVNKTGSVYNDVIVPDFAKDPLSLSGVIVSASPASIASPKDAFLPLFPVVPTTRREFEKHDQASVFLRVYQGGKKPAAAVALNVRIVDTHDATVITASEEMAADHFGADRAADYRFALPLARLGPGEYLLTLEAVLDSKHTQHRDVRFTVK